MSNYIYDEMIKKEADVVVFHDIAIDLDKKFRKLSIIREYNLEQVKELKSFPRSARSYYKLVNGKKVLIL